MDKNRSNYQNLDLKEVLCKISNNNLHAYTRSKYRSLLCIKNQLENIIYKLQNKLEIINTQINQITNIDK